MNKYIFYILLTIWNIIVFFTYGLDKYLAKNNKWRISEKALLTMAFGGGGIGAFLGMNKFRHKTKHNNFVVLVPIAGLLAISILVLYGMII